MKTKSAEQQLITDIYNRKAKCGDNDTDLAQVLNRDIATSFAGGNKFLYELLQNADDAADEQTGLQVEFRVITVVGEQYLLFSHNGRHFSLSDIKKITSYANQREVAKAEDSKKIGYKGVGFKAVFTIASSVVIYSRGYRFRFDGDYPVWLQHEAGEAYPWQVIPIWTELDDLPGECRQHMGDDRVHFLMKIKPNSEILSALKFILKNTRMLIFLRQLQQLTISFSDSEKTEIKLKRSSESITKVVVNGQPYKGWLIKSYVISIPEEIKNELLNMGSHACPDRLKKSQEVTVSFAARLTKNKLDHLPNTNLYCYLPTQVKCGLPYLVNADFLLDPARAYLAENAWNQFLLGVIAEKQFEWLADLANDENYRLQVLNVLSKKVISGVSDDFQKYFCRQYLAAANRVAFIPGKMIGTLLTLSQAIIDRTTFYQYFSELSPPVPRKFLVDSALEQLETLKALDVSEIGYHELLEYVLDHVKSLLTVKFHLKLIQYLFDNRKHFKATKLKTVPILLTQGLEVVPADFPLYFPSEVDITDFPGHENIHFLNFELYKLLSESKNVRAWLEELGVKKPDPVQLLRGNILPLIKNNGINEKNVIAITRFIVRVVKKSKLDASDWKCLRNLPILTEGAQLCQPYDCYCPDVLKPKIKLQKRLDGVDVFVSSKYFSHLKTSDDRDRELIFWRKYFEKIGVNTNMNFSCDDLSVAEGRSRLYSFDGYLQTLSRAGQTAKKIQNYHIIVDVTSAPLIRHIVNPSYCHVFIEQLLDQWSTLNLAAEMLYKTAGASQYYQIDTSYLQYILTATRCLLGADGKQHKSDELFTTLFLPLSSYDPTVVVIDPAYGLTDEQIEYFHIRDLLTFNQCVTVLSNFDDDVEVACYAIVWRQLLRLEQTLSDRDQSNLKKMQLLLPNQNNDLCARESINCFAIPDEVTPMHSDDWLKHFPGFSQQEMVRIAQLFGVGIVGQQKRVLDFGKKAPVLDQETTMKFLCPISQGSSWNLLGITVWLESRLLAIKAPTIWDKVLQKFLLLQFYNAYRLSYHFGANLDAVVNLNVYLDKNKFYYMRDWLAPTRLDKFVECLGGYLELSSDTIIKLERLIRVDQPQVFLDEWMLPEQPPVWQKMTEIPQPVIDDTVELEQENISDEDEAETSDVSFESEESSTVDSYEIRSPRSISRDGRSTPNSTPVAPRNKKSTVVANPSPKDDALNLIDPQKFDYQKFDKIPAATFSVKKNANGKTKVSVELLDDSPANTGPGKSHSTPGSVKHPGQLGQSSGSVKVTPKRALTQDDKDRIGRCGEELIYLRQRYKYETRYPDCQIDDKANGFHIYGSDQQGDPVDIMVIWHNKDQKRDEDRDITVIKPKGKRYLEVKASTTNKREFSWTAREIALAERKGSRYKIFFIATIGTAPTITKIKDPHAELGKSLTINAYKIGF